MYACMQTMQISVMTRVMKKRRVDSSLLDSSQIFFILYNELTREAYYWNSLKKSTQISGYAFALVF